MDPLNPRVEATFCEALTHSSPEARDAFLKEACAADDSLQAVVRRMLQAHEEADAGFLSATPGQRAAQAAAAAEALDPALAAPITPALAAELDRREAEADADPEAGQPWPEIKTELAGKRR